MNHNQLAFLNCAFLYAPSGAYFGQIHYCKNKNEAQTSIKKTSINKDFRARKKHPCEPRVCVNQTKRNPLSFSWIKKWHFNQMPMLFKFVLMRLYCNCKWWKPLIPYYAHATISGRPTYRHAGPAQMRILAH